MGLDVRIIVEASEWRRGHPCAHLVNDLLDLSIDNKTYHYPSYDLVKEYDDGRYIVLDCIQRWYGPDYERGSWPEIYGAFRLLQRMYPESRIWYGSDSYSADEIMVDEYLVTPEFCERMWTHYVSDRGDDYRRPHHW